ncbi:transcriptional regulator [Pseudoalteromonas sp. GCY]|uniref:helix-turn-helix domain-containing protein n=1 Tax=Pseudoalteromonas sp. GCY TaxID=2003316 RepID=UPI000BFF041B|nr:helix-turn-helix transcriptional regulator [Pseudoalteromonas sp. GCY]PHI34638.1 transcriptional regulator [Pseudoalteromonas sp. GCY]QQQ66873.1 helix-turn-helix transcriptional regulator [Pseudoalteromonas sp. GCY]
MDFINPLPIRLKEARTRANISQRDLGIRIGLEPGSASGRMNHYEKGRHTPDLQTLKRIAEELGVPLNYFFCENDEMAKFVILFEQLSKAEKLELIDQLELSISSKT